MKIVWDEPKRLANLAMPGIDFTDIGEAFFDSATIFPAKQGRPLLASCMVSSW